MPKSGREGQNVLLRKRDTMFDIPPYESLNITTATLVVTLAGRVNRETAFNYLPVVQPIIDTLPSGRRYVRPVYTPGAVLSMQWKDRVRGYICSEPGRYFKNCVNVYIRTTNKRVNLKLSTKTIQMCGVSIQQDVTEAVQFLIGQLNHTQAITRSFQDDTDKAVEAVTWVLNRTRGEAVITDTYKYNFIDGESNYSFTVDNLMKSDIGTVDTQCDERLVNYLLGLRYDFAFHSGYLDRLLGLASVDWVITPDLSISRIDGAMANYNYNLGFSIDRFELYSIFDDSDEFYARYDNAIVNNVSIEMPYTPNPDSGIKPKKHSVPHHSFLVYRSGSVTQSGPDPQTMRAVYYLFMNKIASVRDRIELVGDD
jgi:hypothetical protein